MSTRTQSYRQTIQHIVDILSFDTCHSALKEQLSHVNWDLIVSEASKHLLLPAMYCRLQQRQLLECMPADLNSYLEALTQLNRERNQSLLAEALTISKLFQNKGIDHVFIKGIALLAGHYFEDIGERMIGDMDILVASKDLDIAFQLLVKEGYSEFVEFNYEVKNYRHRPRQISKVRLGAVELHDQLLKHRYNHLIDKDLFLATKETNEGIQVPNRDHLIWNTIMAHQINDHNSYFGRIKLKGIYDLFVLKLNESPELQRKLLTNVYSSRFLTIASVYAPTLVPLDHKSKQSLHKYIFLQTINYPVFGHHIYKMKWISLNIRERFKLVLNNRSYRQHLLKNSLYSKIYENSYK